MYLSQNPLLSFLDFGRKDVPVTVQVQHDFCLNKLKVMQAKCQDLQSTVDDLKMKYYELLSLLKPGTKTQLRDYAQWGEG